MKKIFAILFFTATVVSTYSQKISKEDMNSFKTEWKAYSDSCFNDSTLYIYWEYTGQEKKEASIDTTGGNKTKVVTIVPTRKMNWTKENPTIEGFEKYINKRKDE